MKNYRVFALVAVLLLSALWVQPAQAKTIVRISIVRNLATRHLYFSPAHPQCIAGNTVIRLENRTESIPVIQKENGQRFLVQPYQKITENEHPQKKSRWALLEPGYLGGNAYVYFKPC